VAAAGPEPAPSTSAQQAPRDDARTDPPLPAGAQGTTDGALVASEQPAQATEAAAPSFRGEVRGSHIVLAGAVAYDEGKATLRPDSYPALRGIKRFMDENPRVTTVRVEVHMDAEGDEAASVRLSGQRAVVVTRWLVAQGVAKQRLIAVGFGSSKPMVADSSPENRERNRRTEFHVAAVDAVKFLGRELAGGGQVFR